MGSRLFDSAIVGDGRNVVDFVTNVLEASTEYSIIGKDLDGKILLWNEGARRMYGYEPGEVIGKANSEILHAPEDIALGRPKQMMLEALKNGRWEGVISRIRKDKKRISARVVITPRLDASGKAVGFLLISKDVSNELRFKQDLRKTKLFDSAIVGNAQEAVDFIGNILESSTEYAVIGKSLDGTILLWNEGARRLYGYEPEEVVGKANSSMLHVPEDVQSGKPQQILDAALATGKWEGTIQRLRKSGERFTARVVITPRRDANGKAIGYLLISKDISEEIRLTDQLQATQFYTRSLIESNIDALMTTDPLGVITDVNQQMEVLTGHSRNELIGSPFKTYFTDPQRAEQGIRQVLREGKVTNYELTAISKAGKTTTVSYNASTFKDAEGRLQGVFAAARDITEQKKLEGQLRDSESYNRGLIEASVDGLITVDPSGTISDVNDQMCRMSGYRREELIGTPFADYFVDADRATAGVNETFTKGVVTNYELTLATRENRRLRVSFNASVFKDQAGAVRGIFASARDITEQARLQGQLAEERAYNRGLIEASVDGLVTVDESMTITDVNETMCRMAGRQRNQLIGSPFGAYFTERERAEEGVRLTFREGAVTNYVLTLQAADSRQVPVSFNAAVFKDVAGKVRGIFASARDIAAQKQLEGQLQASQFYTRSLIESNIDALMTTDSLGIITDVNQQMEALTGRTREELIGSPFKTHFTDPERAEAGIKLVLREGRVTNYELTARAKDGRETVVSYNAVTFNDAQGKLQGVFAAARDITEQKKLEEQLRQSQDYNRGLIEASVDGLVTVDPSGTVTDVNDRMCQMTGYGRGELVGTAFSEYFTEPGRASDGVRQTFDQGVVTEYALTLISRSRRLLQVSFNASVFKDECGHVR